MPSIVDLMSNKPAVMILLEALAKSDPDLNCLANLQDGVGKESRAEVKVTINGHEVDFVAAIQKGMDDLIEGYNLDVKEAARELLRGTSLGNLVHELENAEWKITQALAQITGDHL